ncbi:alpha/beta hydrolase family protein [Sphingobacterium zeae]|uniref:Pimeloyl-ACP methyl ester carboxylesterase n=1 Tax=Sphingobacterium zeae TaxID=1776859 RepID=A0ABU0U4B4_9SPHI|nr:alpha/beta fold hydrolase [Sphingobacterium zeae]MDQ1149812.1 pimeloyl-ACP methyl ester carboxylesterase [Sphingobacterium zeae]
MPKIHLLDYFPSKLISVKRIRFNMLLSLMVLYFIPYPQNAKAQQSDWLTKDIIFGSEGIQLAGSILQPKHARAAIVLVHGSGQEKRMTEFASFLARNGIAVFTYDKRGVGKSEGIYAGPEVGTNNIDSANLNLLAKDAQEAVTTFRQQLDNPNIPIGLLGFSQAGWIIPLAANKNPLIDFFVLYSGAVIPAREQLRFQFFTNGRKDFWDKHTETEARQHVMNDPDRYQFINTDPVASLKTTAAPGLWLFGSQDIQIPVGLSIERLNALKAQGKPFEYCLFPALDHNTNLSASDEPSAIALQWIKSRTKLKFTPSPPVQENHKNTKILGVHKN